MMTTYSFRPTRLIKRQAHTQIAEKQVLWKVIVIAFLNHFNNFTRYRRYKVGIKRGHH